MKAVVKKPFRDRHTDVMRYPGEVLEITRERFDEIRSVDAGLVAEKRERRKKADE